MYKMNSAMFIGGEYDKELYSTEYELLKELKRVKVSRNGCRYANPLKPVPFEKSYDIYRLRIVIKGTEAYHIYIHESLSYEDALGIWRGYPHKNR